jgi:hypothetical protein
VLPSLETASPKGTPMQEVAVGAPQFAPEAMTAGVPPVAATLKMAAPSALSVPLK